MSTIVNMQALRRENGSPLRLGPKIKAGGEGTIYQIVGEAHLVAKIYHKYSPESATKLRCMLDNPPDDPTRRQGHISIAWPTERIFDLSSRCVGFLMPSIDTVHSYPLLQLYNPKDRRQTLPGFNWLYLLRTARNLASVLQALHDKGYVVGDLNESNILVTSTALVTVVDCDSMQVRGRNQVFRCMVGKPEYTPPELQGCNFSRVERFPAHDNFALAVMIFLILMEGRHPFTGVWQGANPPPTLDQNIKARNFPYANNSRLLPSRHALPFNFLPPSLQTLMRRGLTADRARRPSAGAWFHALHSLEGQLEVCRINTQHIYSEHLRTCPWCERKQLTVPSDVSSRSSYWLQKEFSGLPTSNYSTNGLYYLNME